MSETQWKQFVKFFGEKNKHLSTQQVLQLAKKPFRQLQKRFNQRGGKVKVLDVLDLSGKELDWDAIEYAMDNDIQYENIIFKNCMITDDDLKQLCVDDGQAMGAFFIGGESIKKLDLSHNYINSDQDGSLKYLCKLIKDNDMSPDEIDLSHNNIDDDGLHNLMVAIEEKDNVRVLKLNDNNFSEDGLMLAGCYLKRRKIVSFEFHISTTFCPSELLEAILYNPGLKVIKHSERSGRAPEIIDINSTSVKILKEQMAAVACH